MNCLCCGKPLHNENDPGQWHPSCIKKFFGTKMLPEISVDESVLEDLAARSTSKGFTVPGVQKKLSLHLFSEKGRSRLTLVDYPTGYILKPQVAEFEALPEAEQLVMCMADAVGIHTVPHALIRENDVFSYITKRIDRVSEKGQMKMLAMEDFCQLGLRLTENKYKSSYERCAKIIDRYSSRKGMDKTELYLRLVFSFVIGNSDMHLKNFSLIETEEKSGRYILSPAYDLLPVNLLLPEDTEQFALAMNGKKSRIRKKDFLVFADRIGIPSGPAMRMITFLISKKELLQAMCRDSYLPAHLKDAFCDLIDERIGVLDHE